MRRPFRLWNTATKSYIRWSCYSHRNNAFIGALITCKWATPGTTIEVINIDTGTMFAQYTRTPTSIKFMKG